MKKQKKESIVIFEDWIKYARCLNDNEFRQMISAVFEYHKTQTMPKFEGLLLEVWNDIIDDVQENYTKREAQRERASKARRKNPKHQVNTEPNTKSNTILGTESKTESKTNPNTIGMVDGDGRLEMGDRRLEIKDVAMGDEEMEIRRLIDEGYTFETLQQMFPHTQSLADIYLDA